MNAWTLVVCSLLAQEVDLRPRKPAAEGTWEWSAVEEGTLRAREQAVEEKDGRFVVEGGGFVVDVPASARLAAEVSVFAESCAERFTQEFRWEPRVAVTPTVRLFATEAEYRERCPTGEKAYFRYFWSGRAWPEFHVYGFLAPRPPAPADAEGKSPPTLDDVDRGSLQREIAQALLRRVVGRGDLPAWLDEGICAWFQSCDLRVPRKDDGGRYQRSPYRAHLRFTWAEPAGRPWTLDELFALDALTINPDGFRDVARTHLGLAESFADLLLSSKEGRKTLTSLLDAAAAGRPIERLLAKRKGALQKEWHAHVDRVIESPRSLRPGRAGVPPPK